MKETKLSRRDSLRGIAALGVAGAAVAVGATLSTTEADAAQPYMRAALNNLGAALRDLQRATPNKGGHRVRAIALVRDAIDETRAGMSVAG